MRSKTTLIRRTGFAFALAFASTLAHAGGNRQGARYFRAQARDEPA